MSFRAISVAAAVFLCASAPAAGQSVKLEFENGSVSLSAQNAPVRMILAEWTRLGGTRIINGEGVPGAPLTLELAGVPERQALDILLRGASGYLLGPRQTAANGASAFDRIMILPTSSAPRNLPPPPPASAPGPLPMFPDPDDLDLPEDLPDEFAPDGDLPENQRFRAPRDFVPPDGIDGQPMPPQPFQPEPDDDFDDPDIDERSNEPAWRPVSPFGVPPGGLRPGEIAPVPRQPQGRSPQIGDEP